MIDQAPREVQGQAKAILKAMRSFDFVFCLLLMHKVMKITEVLCQTLQRKSLDFVHAMNFVGLTKSLLQEMREKGWNDLVRDVESFCEKHDIDMPDMNACYKDGTGRRCQQRDFITVEHHYHIDVFNALVDFQLSELNRRFSDQASELLILGSTLDPRDNFRNFKIEDICNLAKKFYPEDFDDGEMFALELECAYYEKDMRSDPKFQNLESISDLCRTLVQTRKSEFFPMLHRLICLILIIPVSTATTERAFSAMNIVKSKLRNKMEDEFLGDCMVLHIEKDYAESITNDEQSCHEEESSALLQFKESFIINSSISIIGAYPKVLSWKLGGKNNNCCSWDGVECDEKTGHVIALDLSSSCLYGSINSSSSLFRLVHLQRLNLAHNYFNYSQIPSAIRNFPRLRYLNLSDSVFSGEVPSEVSLLSKLSTLDLSINFDRSMVDHVSPGDEKLLKMNASTMRSLVQNLTSLQKLHLSFTNISSPVPNSIANLSFLTSLLLEDCAFSGEFPIRIFKLENLKTLRVRFNHDLIGHVPEFNRSSPLVSLGLASTSFSGSLPSSIEKLDSLNFLDISACSFSGVIPFSVGNLKQLNYLNLSNNRFTGPVPESLANLTQLTYLSLSHNNHSTGPLSWVSKQTKLAILELESINLSGHIPSSLCNLTELSYLYLRGNELTGPIPSSLGNLSRLVDIALTQNKFYGPIPESFYNVIHLQNLMLDMNSLTGVVEFDRFLKLQNVIRIFLSYNNLELLTESGSPNATVAQLQILLLSSCSIREFPDFLRFQQKLQWLDLSANKLHGQVPKWMWNTSPETLHTLEISHNFLSSFGQPQADQHLGVLPWLNLRMLRFSNNSLQGPLPIPPPYIEIYDASANKLSGEISPRICYLTSLQFLDLSSNKLSGMLPQCLGYFSNYLTILRLGNNSFQGILPQMYSQRSILKMIDVSHNQLHGQLPRSLANCVMLEFLGLSNNYFSDVFPFWLGTLPELKVLALRSNGFYGVLGKPEYSHGFPKLCIFDLSYNNFTGEFLIDYIFSENAMIRVDISVNQTTYMGAKISGSPVTYGSFPYSMSITVKGLELYYPVIQEAFAVIDISSNRFEGRIQEFIGNLKGLRSLNISNNIFTGSIPSFLGNLTLLESLDVSQNKLSGEIPQQLVQLTFLAKFNVSHNNLTGPIPHGTQLTSFDITSYGGNSGLCGDPLPEKCGNPLLPPSSVEDNDSIEFNWKFVVAGFGSGLVVGVVLADLFITRFREWFIEIVGIITPMKRRRQS